MAQTYCEREDIESILGVAGVLALIDDDQDGTEASAETLHATNAIERAAVDMNSALRNQYVLSELADNDWCKWCNAYLAAYYLLNRKNSAVPASVADEVVQFREKLAEARWGRFQVPEQAPSFQHTPAVSNFQPEIRKFDNPIRVYEEESTGTKPTNPNISREPAFIPGNL